MKRSKTDQHFTLPIDEIARLFDVDERTVRRWVEDGLPREADGRFRVPEAVLWFVIYRLRSGRQDIDGVLLWLGLRALKLVGEPFSFERLDFWTFLLTGFIASDDEIADIIARTQGKPRLEDRNLMQELSENRR